MMKRVLMEAANMAVCMAIGAFLAVCLTGGF